MPKVNFNQKKPKIPNKNKLTCATCGKLKVANNFYMSYLSIHSATGRIPYCKECLKEMSHDSEGKIIIEKFKTTLELIDKPFLYDLFKISIEEHGDTFGVYMKNLSLKQNRDLTWVDSMFLPEKSGYTESSLSSLNDNDDISEYDINKLKEKFGYGYPNDEYILFEKKYQQLKPSIKILTTMHDEYLKEYCVNKVKETLAKSRGDLKEAKEWSLMAKDSANAGKLQPSQMSKADLTGGLDTFGQVVKGVEEAQDIIEILPKFLERPKDKVDVVLWHYINYIRDLKGLPACEYKEIYAFYKKREQEYEKHMLDNESYMISDVSGDSIG